MIFVIGANGQVGQELQKTTLAGKATFLTRSQLDISNLDMLQSFLKDQKISTLINAAAYNLVDKAESDREIARRINTLAPEMMAYYANKYKFKFIHFSTDYVFDGKSSRPYIEKDETAPLNCYGKTKQDADVSILNTSANSLILRTSWLYSIQGRNFLSTIRNLSKTNTELKVVSDQIGTPTSVSDLSEIVLKSIDQDLSGLFHFSNEGAASWYDFATEIIKSLNLSTTLIPILSKDYQASATRPNYSVLDKNKIKKALGIEIKHWKDSLAVTMKA